MVDLASVCRKALVATGAGLLAGCTPSLAPPLAPSVLLEPYAATSGEVRKALEAALERHDAAAVTRHTVELAWMGASLSDASFDRIAPSLDLALLANLRLGRMHNSKQPVADLRGWFHENVAATRKWNEPELFASVPAEYRLVEGIAWDQPGERLFVGTVIDGRLAYLSEDGQWHELALGSPRASLFGMAIDPVRRLLWIATGSLDRTAVPGPRMTGLIAVDLATLTVSRRVPVAPADKGAVGDLTIAPDGTVYASNVLSGAIHRCRPGCTVLEDFLPAGSFRSPQGLGFARGARRLYVADYVTGLWTVDTRTAAVAPVPLGSPAMLEGIDGLIPLQSGNGLVAIQNGSSPHRITMLYPRVAHRRGMGVFARTTFAADAPEPTLGTVKDMDLLFVGDGQWERYGPGGIVKDGKPPRPTPILRVPVIDPVY